MPVHMCVFAHLRECGSGCGCARMRVGVVEGLGACMHACLLNLCVCQHCLQHLVLGSFISCTCVFVCVCVCV